VFWSDSMQKLLIEMYVNGPLTRHDQNLYDSSVGFRLINKKLRNRDLVREVGRTDEGRKLWDLTERALKTKQTSDTFEVECPNCEEEHEVEVKHEVNIIEAIKILRIFFGEWQDDKIKIRDGSVVCRNCKEEYPKDVRICECESCGKILKW